MSNMIDEIREQPATIERTLRAEWGRAAALRAHFEKHPVGLVILAARGTSDNAAQFGRYLIEITTGIPVSLAAPSVQTLYHAPLRLQSALVVALSQSGESTDTIAVLSASRQAGAFSIGITNEAESTMARESGETLLVHAGKERSVAATKTYTGQLTCLYLLAYALGAPLSFDGLMKVSEFASAALSLDGQLQAMAERYCFVQHAVCLGRGLNYSNSFELSLKLMETCYVIAERFSSADLMHGPIAMLETQFPAVVFCPPGETWESNRELLGKLDAINADVLVISDQSNGAIGDSRSKRRLITVPAEIANGDGALPQDIWTPIPYIVPGQLLAAHLAAAKGLNPDQPRTLSKVTLTM